MLLINRVLDDEDLKRVTALFDEMRLTDGKQTAGAAARKVKSNQQADWRDPKAIALRGFLRKAMERHPLFMSYVRPAKWSRLTLSRYGVGNAYGMHTDDAMMKDETGGHLRTDLSFTLFLSPRDSYEGGALSLESVEGVRDVRLAAGDMIVYRTGLLHQVTPVTEGERRACVGWVQSQIRRDDQREVLFDLDQVRASLPESAQKLMVDKSVGNLLRMWSEV
jgi:PKHD-type hydroxylase